MKKLIKFTAISLCSLLFVKSLLAIEYGKVVRIQCERTGQYLVFDPNNDINGDKRIVLSDVADDNGLWIVKGPLTAPVDEANPYDRWNCLFGDTVPTGGYDARLEHVVTGLDAHFGDNMTELTDHIHPYFFNVGQDKLQESSAVYFYNIVLDLNGEKKILISNEFLCALSNNETTLTQDSVVDTWNIIPEYMMTDDLRATAEQDLLDALKGVTEEPEISVESFTDHLIEDVTALIDFYNNEAAYRQAVKNAFAALAAETDINTRISIVEGLAPYTTGYNDQIATLFGNIEHPTTNDLITCIQDTLVQNKTEAITLRDAKNALTAELDTVNADLAAVGATSVPDLTNKVNQLIALLNAIW